VLRGEDSNESLVHSLNELAQTIGKQQRLLADLNRQIEERRVGAQSVLSNALKTLGLKGVEEDKLRLFVERPWIIGPRDEHSCFL